MTPKKVIIEITSTSTTASVFGEDDEVLGTYTWKKAEDGFGWRGQKDDWYAILNNQSEDEGDFDELAEALEDTTCIDIGRALASVNFED